MSRRKAPAGHNAMKNRESFPNAPRPTDVDEPGDVVGAFTEENMVQTVAATIAMTGALAKYLVFEEDPDVEFVAHSLHDLGISLIHKYLTTDEKEAEAAWEKHVREIGEPIVRRHMAEAGSL